MIGSWPDDVIEVGEITAGIVVLEQGASASSPRSGRFIPWKERSSARLIRLREPRASTSGPPRRSATIRVAARILKLREPAMPNPEQDRATAIADFIREFPTADRDALVWSIVSRWPDDNGRRNRACD